MLRPDDPSFVLERVVTVLVIACPHALGLAIPLVAQISTAIGAKNGLLIRSRLALEEARRVEVVLFDKTGTLTRGEQGVTLPSASWMVGLRSPSGVEFGIGPNVTPAGVALAVAGGVTFRSGALNVPITFAVVPSKDGMRVSMLTGFNFRGRR